MTTTAQRIAIAEACGWKRLASTGAWISPLGRFHYPPEQTIPSYLHDLNAMHEAEKVLTPAQRVIFRTRLATLCGDRFSESVHATAAQRARAFLETLGLWGNGSD